MRNLETDMLKLAQQASSVSEEQVAFSFSSLIEEMKFKIAGGRVPKCNYWSSASLNN
jgi:hypothetical protein